MTTPASPTQIRIAAGNGGWSFPLNFVDQGGNPVDLTKAGLTPAAQFYQPNTGATTNLVVSPVNAASGQMVAVVPDAVVKSTIFPAPDPSLLGGLLSTLAPAPFCRLYAYLVDALGNRTSEQAITIEPVDWRTADFSVLPVPPALTFVVGPSGPPGQKGDPGPQGIPGGLVPISGQATSNIVAFQVVHAAPGGVAPASSADPTQAGSVVGIALQAASSGQTVSYQDGGTIANQAWTWSPGPIFFDNNGQLTQNAPTGGFVQQVATAQSATTISVRLGPASVIGGSGSGSYKDSSGGVERMLSGVTSYGGAAKGKMALFTRNDGYLDGSVHPPGGLLGGTLEHGDHLSSLPNGAFLDGLVGWTNTSTGAGAAAIDATASLSGTNALKLTTQAASDVAQVTSLSIPVAGGKPAYFGVLARTVSGSASLALALAFFDASGAALSSGGTAAAIAAYAPGAAYAEASAIVTPPAAARFMTITPTMTGAAGVIDVGQVRYDQNLLSKFTAAPAGHRRALNVHSVSLADFCNVATTADHTAALTAAVAAVAAIGGGEVIFPPGYDYYFSAGVNLPAVSGTHITLRGPGLSSRIRRVAGYKGNIFVVNTNVAGNCRVKIEDFFFFSDYSRDTNPGAAAILLTGAAALGIDVSGCLFWDQYAAIDLNGCAAFKIYNCRVFHSAQAATAGFGGYSGLFLTGHCFNGFVSNFSAEGQNPGSPNNLKYGILIQGADGVQFSNIYLWAFYGLRFLGGAGFGIDDVYFTNLIADNCNFRCISIDGNNAPNVYTNLRFSCVHADTHNGVSANGSSTPIVIQGDADGIQFDGLNCGLGDGTGIYISGSGTNWAGRQRRDIRFNNVMNYDNNQANAANTHGILIDCPGVTIIGGSSRNQSGSGHQSYGIAITANGGNATVIGFDVSSNVNSGIYQDPSASGVQTSVIRTS